MTTTLQAACLRCAAAVDLHTAAQTGGYCRGCAPALPGMEHHVTAQVHAAEAHAGDELTEEMRQSAGDISRKAGTIERDSPLFRGSGENPTLF